MPRFRHGRPLKYHVLYEAIDAGTLYSPASIAKFAEENGLLKSNPEDLAARKKEKVRIRIAVARFAKNRGFGDEDGFVTIKGQKPAPAWFGWRWKAAIAV